MMDELIQMIEEWSKERGIDKADPQKQMLKIFEEIGEVSAAVIRDDKDALRDAIGDSVITLLNLSLQNDMSFYECLMNAYGEIQGRDGKMINGMFVKSDDMRIG